MRGALLAIEQPVDGPVVDHHTPADRRLGLGQQGLRRAGGFLRLREKVLPSFAGGGSVAASEILRNDPAPAR